MKIMQLLSIQRLNLGLKSGEWIDTGAGRVIFNDVLGHGLPFYNEIFDKGRLKALVTDCHRRLGPNKTAEILDSIKNLTFKYATKSGITISVSDVDVPQAKYDIIKDLRIRLRILKSSTEGVL